MSGACLLALGTSSDTTSPRTVDLRIPVGSTPVRYVQYKSSEVRLTQSGDRCKGAIGVLKRLRYLQNPDGGYERMGNDTGGCTGLIMPIISNLQTAAELTTPPPVLPSSTPAMSEESKKRRLPNAGPSENKRAHVAPRADVGLSGSCDGPSPECAGPSVAGSVCSADGDASDDGSAETPGCGRLTGRWTREEHEAFLEGLKMHGREWKKVAQKITTRTSAQIRSHAQKYFTKLAKEGQDNAAAANPSYHSASVIEKIELIMKNPVAVENEVNSTLQMLTDRYNVLRRKIEAKQASRVGGKSDNVSPGPDLSFGNGLKISTFQHVLPGGSSLLLPLPGVQPVSSTIHIVPPQSTKPILPGAQQQSNIRSVTTNNIRQPSPTPSNSSLLSEGEHIALEVLGAELPKEP